MSKGIDAALDELRVRRLALATEQANVEAAIATLEKLNGVNGAVAVPTKRGPHPADDAVSLVADPKATAEQMWKEGRTAKNIAKALGITVSTIYNWSSKGKWKRAPRGVVTCPSCGTETSKDPCFRCGQPTGAAD